MITPALLQASTFSSDATRAMMYPSPVIVR
jgi:hypothetical protein